MIIDRYFTHMEKQCVPYFVPLFRFLFFPNFQDCFYFASAKSDLQGNLEELCVARRKLRTTLIPALLPSFVFLMRMEFRKLNNEVSMRHNIKLECLSANQDRPLLQSNEKVVTNIDAGEVPRFVTDLLSMGPKHSVRDKFKEMDQLLGQLKADSASSDSLDEAESAAHWYIKRIKRTHLDLAVDRVGMYLRDHKLLAVRFDKGVGFAILKADTYWRKLSEVLASNQFQPDDCDVDIVIKLERSLNRELLLLKKRTTSSWCLRDVALHWFATG